MSVVRPPDLLIYLKASVPHLVGNIQLRGREYEQAMQLGVEWTTQQCRELYEHGVRNIHFYTVSAVDSVAEVTKRLL